MLAVDAGTTRVGLALSDPSRAFAFPLEVVPEPTALERIRDLVTAESVVVVVLGIPYTMSGEEGPEARRVRKFQRALEAAISPTPVETQDERLSSSAADHALTDRARRARKRGEIPKRDAVAAAIILESWLARNRPSR